MCPTPDQSIDSPLRKASPGSVLVRASGGVEAALLRLALYIDSSTLSLGVGEGAVPWVHVAIHSVGQKKMPYLAGSPQKARDPHIWLSSDSVIPGKQEVCACSWL